MVRSEEITIGESRFVVTQLPAMRALKLFNRLCKALGPSFATAAGAAGKDFAATDASKLGKAVEMLFENLTPEEMESIFRDLFETVNVVGPSGQAPLMKVFDAVFTGQLEALVPLTKLAVEINYGGFLAGLGAKLRALLPARAFPSAASNISNGQPGV
jgi:hypothetical protein